MLLVQKYLETHTFGDLIRDHGVYASVSKSKHKFSLNYDQIEAKESDPLAQECRGLILASADGQPLPCHLDLSGKRHYENIGPGKTVVLAYPMKRFFNYGQGSAAEINWSDPNLAVLEKLDGTLCIVYYDRLIEEWCVATRSVSEADLMMDNGLFTFRTLFEKALKDTTELDFNEFVKCLYPNNTYCFELTTPYNRIVVDYKNNGITLLAVRDLMTGLEVYPDQCDLIKANIVPCVQAHTYTTVDELVNWVSSLNPMEHEGVVVRDSNFNRIKVKNAAYVAYNKVRDRLATSERNIVELILAEKDDDVISMLPEEIVKNLQKIKAGIVMFIKDYDAHYQAAFQEANQIAPGDKKTFAILVTKNKQLWSAPFFQMFEGKASNMMDFIRKARKNGSWGDGFLDRILELAKAANAQ
jgi:T4 RnlA family RNA ligase